MRAETLAGGYDNPAVQSACAFRSIMEAMARPGTLRSISGAEPPSPLSGAAGGVLLTLSDTDTPLYLAGDADNADMRAWLAFHAGVPMVGPSCCIFAVGTWDALLPLTSYPIGTSEYPDRSATLIVECAELAASGARLRGPGIKSPAALSLPDIESFQSNRALFPLGLDFILTSGHQLAALPRTTHVSTLGDREISELIVSQIREQLKLAVDRVMAEGSLYDPDLAALAIKQSRGRSDRSDLSDPSLSHHSAPFQRSSASSMMRRAARVSATGKST